MWPVPGKLFVSACLPQDSKKTFAVFGNVTSRGISLRHSAGQHRRPVLHDENINDDLGGDAAGDNDVDDERGHIRERI